MKKKQPIKMTALAGLITSLVLAVVSAGQPATAHSATNASSAVGAPTATSEIEWP